MSTLTDTIEVPSIILDQINSRLVERKIVIERDVLRYGEAPAGIKEVFELCRGFERAYVEYVNESPVAGKVKEAFMGEKGLAGQVKKAPLEDVFKLSSVKAVCRYADGYQPHLVSPENGIKALGCEALELVSGPVKTCVQAVYTLLVNAAREAAEKAGHHTEAALCGSLPMYVPDFKNVVMPAIVAALDEWKLDAERMAVMLVDMERSYITAGFFRHTMHNRYEKIKQQQAMAAAMAQGNVKGAGLPGPAGTPGAQQKSKSYFPAFGAGKPEPELQQGPASAPSQAAPDASTGGGNLQSMNMSDPNDFVAAYFDKYGSNESGVSQSLPSSWKWQRRFFIFSDSQKMIYYFKSPDDVPKANGLRGQVNMAECVVEDLDDKGVPRHPGSAPPNSADKAHWMMRIRHKDPRQSAVKEHNSIVLRAETLTAKVEWLARLRRATGEAPKKPVQQAPPPAPGQAQAPDGAVQAGAEGSQASNDFAVVQQQQQPQFAAQQGANLLQEAEPILDTHLGQGARMFRADSIRDPDGRLPPAPRVLLNPLRLQDSNKSHMEKAMDKVKEMKDTVKDSFVGSKSSDRSPFEVQYDALLEQFGTDMSMYMRMVCDTVCTTVPKAVVHCMIKKSQKNLLERLFTVIHKLTPTQMETLLKEDDAVVLRRQQARKVFEDVKSSIFAVHQLLERQNMAAPAERAEKVTLSANVFAYAGMPNILTPEQRAYFDKLFSDQFSPDCMRFWANAPQSAPRSVLPGQLSPGQQQAPQQGSPQQQQQPQQGSPQQQQQQQQQAPPVPMVRGPPPPGQPGAQLGMQMQRPGGPPGPPPMRPAPTPGGVAPPPVPMRPAPGTVQPGMGPPMTRRPPPPPPGTR